MALKTPKEEQVKFQDVVACFSEEEWTVLHEEQKHFYKKVMKKIHQAVILLGYQIVNVDSLLRIHKGKGVCMEDPMDTARPDTNKSDMPSPPVVAPEVVFRIAHQKELRCRNLNSPEEGRVSSCSTASVSVGTETLSLIKEEEEEQELYPSKQQVSESRFSPSAEIVIVKVKAEDENDQSDGDIAGYGNMSIQKNSGRGETAPRESGLSNIKDFEWESNESGFQFSNDLRRTHQHQRLYPCTECDRSYSNSRELKRHILTHTGVRPYPCPGCEKSFYRKSHLNRHFRVHTGERPYMCLFCDKGFTRKYLLSAHMIKHSVENNTVLNVEKL